MTLGREGRCGQQRKLHASYKCSDDGTYCITRASTGWKQLVSCDDICYSTSDLVQITSAGSVVLCAIGKMRDGRARSATAPEIMISSTSGREQPEG
jgi:hypothetical protein